MAYLHEGVPRDNRIITFDGNGYAIVPKLRAGKYYLCASSALTGQYRVGGYGWTPFSWEKSTKPQ
jgi:hypothetical protein